MKIVIFSDSHGDPETMCGVTEKEKPDMIVHLGDGIADLVKLIERYPDVELIKVLGSVDSGSGDDEWLKLINVLGRRIVITHGHTFINYTYINELEGYKRTGEDRAASNKNILQLIIDNNADIFLHGHTHEPCINRIQVTMEKTCWIMNPGSVRHEESGKINPVYGVIELLEPGTSELRLVEVELK